MSEFCGHVRALYSYLSLLLSVSLALRLSISLSLSCSPSFYLSLSCSSSLYLSLTPWRVLKFCSCWQLASSRGFQSRPSSPPTFALSLAARVKQGIQCRRIFPFNICTISHICTTEFAVDSWSPLTTRFSKPFSLHFSVQSTWLWTGNYSRFCLLHLHKLSILCFWAFPMSKGIQNAFCLSGIFDYFRRDALGIMRK